MPKLFFLCSGMQIPFRLSWSEDKRTFLIKGIIEITGRRKRKIDDDYYFIDKYIVHHSAPARIPACYTIGICPPYSFMACAFSNWDDEMKNDAVGYLKKTNDFSTVMIDRLIEVMDNR